MYSEQYFKQQRQKGVALGRVLVRTCKNEFGDEHYPIQILLEEERIKIQTYVCTVTKSSIFQCTLYFLFLLRHFKHIKMNLDKFFFFFLFFSLSSFTYASSTQCKVWTYLSYATLLEIVMFNDFSSLIQKPKKKKDFSLVTIWLWFAFSWLTVAIEITINFISLCHGNQ